MVYFTPFTVNYLCVVNKQLVCTKVGTLYDTESKENNTIEIFRPET